jgi:hypothetical protein
MTPTAGAQAALADSVDLNVQCLLLLVLVSEPHDGQAKGWCHTKFISTLILCVR